MKALLLAALLPFAALAEDPRVTALVVQGDAEERAHRTQAALAHFRSAEQIEPRNVGVLLRISKQYSDLVGTVKPQSLARGTAEKSLAYAQRAVALDPRNAKARLSVAVAYGKLTDFVGNREKLEYSRHIRDEAQRALELDPREDFAWHVLGRWHAGIATVNPLLKAMAGLVYGGLPPASLAEAARHLQRATELAPQRIIHHSELARIHGLQGKRDLAAAEWRTVISLPAAAAEDERDKKEAGQILAQRAGR